MSEREKPQQRLHEILDRQQFEVLDSPAQSINLPLKSPMRLPFGEVTQRPSGVLQLNLQVNGRQIQGLGEGATLPQPLFTDDYGDVIGHAIAKIVEDLKGEQLTFTKAVAKVQNHQFADGHHYPTARMTVEMGLIDALARSTNQTVAEILGVPSSMTEVPFGKSIGGGTVDEILKEAEDAIAVNAKKIKLKVTPQTAGNVIEALHQLRTKHADIELMVDANGTFDPLDPQHRDIIRNLDAQGLIMFEEPVSRVGTVKGIDAVRQLRSLMPGLQTPICLDDCLVDMQTTEQALTEGLADVVNIKPGRIGSIVRAINIAYLCKSLGKQIMVGGMLEATPGRAMTTTLAAFFNTLGFHVPGDLSLAQERLAADLVDANQQLQIGPNGGILLPKTAGWGFQI